MYKNPLKIMFLVNKPSAEEKALHCRPTPSNDTPSNEIMKL